MAEETKEAWAERIIGIIENKNVLNDMKEVTYAQVYRTWDSVAEEVLENYKEIIKKYNNKK